MENLKVLLTLAIILIVPFIVLPKMMLGIGIIILVCFAFRQRNF
mgnify:CR=1 FL=1|jgi:hypothetical protein